jgi:hypothetical protein
MKTVIFKLPTKESKVINNRYNFVNGELSCDEDTAKLLEPILCGYYACKMIVEEPVVDVAEGNVVEKPSLAKAQTAKAAKST